MFQEVVTGTNIIYYLMIMVGSIGMLAKIVNQLTLQSLVKAAGNMQKSTHKLIKLVRSKYEHACMIHDRVENVEAFVEKYIYEYRGILFRIHTWRQLEIQTIWFSGILGFIGASCWYLKSGLCEEVYRYAGLAASEMVLLFVVSQLSDEQHKISRVQNYMVDYLENVCAFRHRKVRQSERERIEVIQTESGKGRALQNENMPSKAKAAENRREVDEQGIFEGQLMQFMEDENAQDREFVQEEGRTQGRKFVQEEGCTQGGEFAQEERSAQSKVFVQEEKSAQEKKFAKRRREADLENEDDRNLSIRIEGEPRKAGKGDLAKRVFGKQEKESEEVHSSVQEERLRKILEEFLV